MNGGVEVSDAAKVLYDGEFAYQQDYEDNPLDVSIPYWRAALGAKSSGFSVWAGYESLGSDDGQAFFSKGMFQYELPSV